MRVLGKLFFIDAPDMSAVIQEIVNRPGWSSGNALAILVTGTGKRTAESFEGDENGAPKLEVRYVVSSATPPPPPADTVIEVRVEANSDDAEESAAGAINLESRDLELVFTNGNQTVGLRFTGVSVPPGVTILEAYLQFQSDETHSGATSLTLEGEAVDHAASFTGAAGNVSSRPRTAAATAWNPAPWTRRGEAGAAQRTPDMSAVIQEIVNRPGWSSGNALAIIVTGSGKRVAESFEGDANGAPLLHIRYY